MENKNVSLIQFSSNLFHIKKYYKSFKVKNKLISKSTNKLSRKVKRNLKNNTKIKKKKKENPKKSEKKIEKLNFTTFFATPKGSKKVLKRTIPEYLDLEKYYKEKNFKQNIKSNFKNFTEKKINLKYSEKKKNMNLLLNKNILENNTDNNTDNYIETKESLFSDYSILVNSSYMSESVDKIIYKDDSSLLKNYEANRELVKSKKNLLKDSINEKIWKFLNCENTKNYNSLNNVKKYNLKEKNKFGLKKNISQDIFEKYLKSNFLNVKRNEEYSPKINYTLDIDSSVGSFDSLIL